MEIVPLSRIFFICLISIAVGIVAAEEIPQYDFVAPGTIEQPGYYRLVNDVIQTSEDACIFINASDVVIDGDGHTIGGKGFNYGVMGGPQTFSNISISDLTIRDFAYGVDLRHMNNGNISNTNIDYCGMVGIVLSQCENVSVENNVIEHSGYDGAGGDRGGILLQEGSRDITIQNNFICENEDGITIRSSRNNIVLGNEITSNYLSGIRLEGSDSNVISRNNISYSQRFGIQLEEYSDNNLIYDNYFFNSQNWGISMCEANTWNVSKTEGENIVQGPFIGGNFWGQPNGEGISQFSPYTEEGFCVAQVLISASDTDYLPLHHPVKIFPACMSGPTDPDLDGMYEDLNGNGRPDFNDIVTYFKNMQWIRQNEPVKYFDYNANERVDFNDLVVLFQEVGNDS